MGYEYRRNEAIIRSKTREFFGVGTVVTATSYLVPVVDFMLIGILLGADAVAAAGLGDSFVDIAELPGFVLSAGGPVAAGILLGVALLAGFMGLCLKGGKAEMEMVVWIAAMVVFGVVEAVTVGLVSIWFVLGSAAGLIAAICEAPIWLQVVLFFAVSIAALIATRPLVRKMMDKNIVPTNADAVLGREARVTEAIDNTVPSGAVYVDGKTWSARSESGETLPEGILVRAVRMEGVKLFVERLQ